ncbi:hypothetical protein ACNSOL_12090 (plasmid) [Aliarcobacter lanthieri]|uniref:hypothetical protein n=1 Tax=Aliarcobacter lanthieri TaxID=1355374 RepID=UPI003AAE03E7
MKKYIFKIEEYADYEPSSYEYLNDENRYWEDQWTVFAKDESEALNLLFKDCERKIIDSKRVKVLRYYGNPELEACENDNFTYIIVGEDIARVGVDFVEKNIIVIEKSFTENKWCSDGIEKISTYLFNDGFSIKEIYRSAPGWSESETLLIGSNNNCYTLHTRGEDTYNRGNKELYQAQNLRFEAISKLNTEIQEKAKIKKKSCYKAMMTSRETFLDREMPHLVA